MLTGCVVGLVLAALIGLACIGVAMAHAADDPYDGDDGVLHNTSSGSSSSETRARRAQ